MKSAGMLAVLFVVFSFNALADDVVLSDNPYAPVVERNIFGLVPIPVPPPSDTKPPDPPSKITPNGIMNLFGVLQVLFKVSVPPKPGLPPHDQSYTMSVGERSDGIEVIKIDKQAGVITFNNHDVIQELSLSKSATASSVPQPGQVTIPSPSFRPPNFRSRQNSNGNQSFGGNNYNSTAAVAYGNNGNNNSAPSYGATAPPSGNSVESQEQLSPEARALLIEQNYMNAKANNDSSAPLFPPTALRQQSDAAIGGQSAPPPP